MVLETLIKLCMIEPDFLEKLFLPKKVGEMGKKKGFLNLKKKLVIIFSWICSIMKIYIICYIPAQIVYLHTSQLP